MGYEDMNDHDGLRLAPVVGAFCGRLSGRGRDAMALACQARCDLIAVADVGRVPPSRIIRQAGEGNAR